MSDIKVKTSFRFYIKQSYLGLGFSETAQTNFRKKPRIGDLFELKIRSHWSGKFVFNEREILHFVFSCTVRMILTKLKNQEYHDQNNFFDRFHFQKFFSYCSSPWEKSSQCLNFLRVTRTISTKLLIDQMNETL